MRDQDRGSLGLNSLQEYSDDYAAAAARAGLQVQTDCGHCPDARQIGVQVLYDRQRPGLQYFGKAQVCSKGFDGLPGECQRRFLAGSGPVFQRCLINGSLHGFLSATQREKSRTCAIGSVNFQNAL